MTKPVADRNREKIVRFPGHAGIRIYIGDFFVNIRLGYVNTLVGSINPGILLKKVLIIFFRLSVSFISGYPIRPDITFAIVPAGPGTPRFFNPVR